MCCRFNSTPLPPSQNPTKHTECLHGFWEPDPSAKPPTLFPQPLAMAAAFDRDLVRRSFDAIADEMRAKNNAVRAARGES